MKEKAVIDDNSMVQNKENNNKLLRACVSKGRLKLK